MGGWIIISGEPGQIEKRVKKFRDIFSVSGVPNIHIELKSYKNDFHILLWSWSNPPVPDIDVSYKEGDNELLLLHGIITDLGRFGKAEGSQTQVGSKILKLWIEKGDNVIPELNGSFSCAFSNAEKKTMTLFTDRFASRSVWYSKENKTWYVSNFPAAIAAIQRRSPHIDSAGLWSLFANSRHVGTRGIFYGIANIPAAQKVQLYSDGSHKMSLWWQRHYHPQSDISTKEWARMIAQSLKESGRRLSRWTPRPYLFLSGGLDSRVAAGALGENFKTVTLTTENNMNSRLADKVAKHLKVQHQTIIRTPYWYLDTFHAASLIGGGNYNIRHAHFINPVQQIRASDIDASFFLGDLLENFNKHYFRPVNGYNVKFIPEKIPDIFHLLYSYSHPDMPSLKRLFRSDLAEKLMEDWSQVLVETSKSILTVSEKAGDCYDSLFRWNNCSWCPTYIMTECIWPFAGERNLMFDNDLAELLLKVPTKIRGAGILHRATLWNLSKGLVFIPNSNYWLPPFFPKPLELMTKRIRPILGKTRRKIISLYRKGPIVKTEGSWHMLHEWYRKDKKYRNFIEKSLFDHESLPPEIFNKKEIRLSWEEFLNGNISKSFEIDMFLTFGLLHKRIPTSGVKFN